MEEATERKCEMASPELFGALRASLELSLIKAVASKFGGNPRSQKPAVGVLTVSASIPESAWRLFHLAIDAPSCVWGGQSRQPKVTHQSAKPKWGNPSVQFCASFFHYEIWTCVALHRVMDCFRLLADISNGDDGDVFSPFPQGWVTADTSFTAVAAAVVDGEMLHAPSLPPSIAGEHGTVIGKRFRLLC